MNWPEAAAVIVIVFLLLFHHPIKAFLGRARNVSAPGGIKVEADAATQAASATASVEATITTPANSSDAAHALVRGVTANPLVTVSEQQIRKEFSDKGVDPTKATDELIYFLAIAAVTIRFERTYSEIFGSQILILQHLSNVGTTGATQDQLRPYYEAAAQKHPDAYKTYGFEAYLDYLITKAQLVSRIGDRLVITIAGREFLSFLPRAGKSTAKFY